MTTDTLAAQIEALANTQPQFGHTYNEFMVRLGLLVRDNLPAIVTALKVGCKQMNPTEQAIEQAAQIIDPYAWDDAAILSDDKRNERQNNAAEIAERVLVLLGTHAGQWQPADTAPKDDTLVELVVDYLHGDHPLSDARLACTIGFNGFDNHGVDEWKFAGWCWTQDEFVQGQGVVRAWRPSRLNACDDGLAAFISDSGPKS